MSIFLSTASVGLPSLKLLVVLTETIIVRDPSADRLNSVLTRNKQLSPPSAPSHVGSEARANKPPGPTWQSANSLTHTQAPAKHQRFSSPTGRPKLAKLKKKKKKIHPSERGKKNRFRRQPAATQSGLFSSLPPSPVSTSPICCAQPRVCEHCIRMRPTRPAQGVIVAQCLIIHYLPLLHEQRLFFSPSSQIDLPPWSAPCELQQNTTQGRVYYSLMCVCGWYQTQGTRQWYRARITRQHARRSPVRRCPLAVLAMMTSVHTYIYYRRRFQKMPNLPRRICCDGACFVTLYAFPGIARPRVSCHRDSASSNHPIWLASLLLSVLP